MVVLKVALVVFAALTKVKSPQVRAAALVMMWSFLALAILSAALLFTSVFFNFPKPLPDLLAFVDPNINHKEFNLTPTVSPDLADEATRRHVEEEAKIAEDRAVTILTEMQADKERVLDAIADRNARRAGRELSSEDRALARIEAKHTTAFSTFSERYDSVVARFQSLHQSYVEAIRNGERIRANAIRNQIHQEQLQYQLEVLVDTADPGRHLTDELSARIRDRFARSQYKDDPIPQDDFVRRILDKVRQSSNISVSDAAKLPEVEAAVVGTVARASGSCLFLRSGTNSNDKSVMVLELRPMSGEQGTSRCIAWFEWGWQSHLKEVCQPESAVTLTGTFVGSSNGVKVLQTSAIPGQRPEPFRYRAPHSSEERLLR
jgi:hypothetical protein